MILYIIKSSLALAVFLLCFRALFKGDMWFKFNRYYLLFSMVIALLFPFFDWSAYWETSYVIPGDIILPLQHGSGGETVETTVSNSDNVGQHVNYLNILVKGIFLFFLTVSAVFLVRFTNNLLIVYKEISNGIHLHRNGFKLVLSKTRVNPHSFLNYIIVNQWDYESGLIDPEIIVHEETHCRQRHTLDILFVELLLTILWWHPLLWIYRKAIKVNHEYLADQKVISATENIQQYAHKIIMANQTAKTHLPVSFFNLSITKNRILMLTKKNKSSIFLFSGKALTMAMVSLVTLTLLSFSDVRTPDYVPNEQGEFVVLIDPGHGAKDSGAKYGEITEKEITLAIAKRLQTNKRLKNVKLIFTRDADQFISLKDRAELAKSQEVDLLLSLHVNSSRD